MQIITTHKNTDFDAFASVAAAALLYPRALAVLPGSLNPNVKAFLSIHKDLFPTHAPAEVPMAQVKRLIVVDANSWERLERMEPLRGREDLEILLWDHHGERGSIAGSWSCLKPVGATTTLLVGELKKKRKLLTPMHATLLLDGIYEDTGSLSFPSTTAEDAHAAGWLLERKADLDVLATFLKPAYGAKQKAILFQMLQSARRINVKGLHIGINRIDLEAHVEGLAVVLRMVLDILNVDAAFGIFHDLRKNRCTVIARSQSEDINVGVIMRSMGGGGHSRAASAQLKAVAPEAVEQWVMELIQGSQAATVRVGDLMSFPVRTVAIEASMEEAALMLRDKGITGIPVVSGDRIVGMISRRDFRRLRKDSQLKSAVKAFMTQEVLTIEPAKSPMQAAQLMVKHDIGRLPVVEDGKVIGIITRSDLMRYFYDLIPD
jgi:nanoRNase/pAp phosphatase (c-di-AMP/oligoRNAs hydrolase)/CBS domain-containing protein